MGEASVGAVKMMVRSLDIESLNAFMVYIYDSPEHTLRNVFVKFAEYNNVSI